MFGTATCFGRDSDWLSQWRPEVPIRRLAIPGALFCFPWFDWAGMKPLGLRMTDQMIQPELDAAGSTGSEPLLCNEVVFREDDPHFDRLQRLMPAFGRGKLSAQAVARIIFRTGLTVAEALMIEGQFAVPAPASVTAEQYELWDEFVAQAQGGTGRG